jgi:aspartate/tyrosine/aromatic aminotransferase
MVRSSLYKLLRWANSYQDHSISQNCTIVSTGDDSISSDPMHIHIFSASGGHVVEYKYWDNKQEKFDRSLHIINTGEDMGERLSQIITMELLRK